MNEAFKTRRQLLFGTFDMVVHTTKEKVDTEQLWAKLMKGNSFIVHLPPSMYLTLQPISDVALTEAQPGSNGAASFGYGANQFHLIFNPLLSDDQ